MIRRDWVEFVGKPNRVRRDEPRVTLNRKCIFLLNKAAFEALDEPEAVKLFYDQRNRSLGIAKTDVKYENAFPVKAKDKYSNRVICASPACVNFGIRVEKTIAFNRIEFDHDGIMSLDLDRATVIGR